MHPAHGFILLTLDARGSWDDIRMIVSMLHASSLAWHGSSHAVSRSTMEAVRQSVAGLGDARDENRAMNQHGPILLVLEMDGQKDVSTSFDAMQVVADLVAKQAAA